jgi:hypothetical protein
MHKPVINIKDIPLPRIKTLLVPIRAHVLVPRLLSIRIILLLKRSLQVFPAGRAAAIFCARMALEFVNDDYACLDMGIFCN